jgi:transcription antitermination factor NusG
MKGKTTMTKTTKSPTIKVGDTVWIVSAGTWFDSTGKVTSIRAPHFDFIYLVEITMHGRTFTAPFNADEIEVLS